MLYMIVCVCVCFVDLSSVGIIRGISNSVLQCQVFQYSDGVYPLAPAGYKKQLCTLSSSPPASSDTTFPFLPCRSDASPPPPPQSPGNLSATGMWAEKKTRLRFGFSHARLSQTRRSRELLTFSTHNIKTHFLFAASGTADSFSAFLNEQTHK